MVFVFVTSAFLSFFSMQCYADISIYNANTNAPIRETFRSVVARFGPRIPEDGVECYAVAGFPVDGCSNMKSVPNIPTTRFWAVIVERGNCSYVDKVRNAQNAGFQMAVVHNNMTGELVPMHAEDDTGINISSVFVSLRTGIAIRNNYLYNNSVYLVIDNDSSFPFDINADLLIPFAVVVTVCFITMISFMICKCIRDRRRARRHRLPASSLKKIPIEKFSKGTAYETCAICLDDYIDGEKLRILPCSHAYHTKCIDPWLTRNRRVCPICKRKVFAADELHDDGSETDSDTDNDERTPLVRSESSQHRQPRRTYLISPTQLPRLFWQHPESTNNNNINSTSTSSRSGSVGDSERQLLPTSIHSINGADNDSLSSGSICSFTYTGRGSLQLPQYSDYSDAQSRNISIGSEVDGSATNTGSHRIV